VFTHIITDSDGLTVCFFFIPTTNSYEKKLFGINIHQ
jgi:hypothetical protein